ncbi:hypothetical protein [Parasphingorhabdus cellanae]|uniref:Tetratricopeptide repeat protein n=1 Tax=Parasphingorhabdus cellanae TaxID=2806553 RepID=A0ABX7TB47_9SPHN|nr:hypothetical protein [Parasphingorhabdus cellanae]QTD57568.1 hypothetical protein J4G78_08635 [Parasphingorhabdus cellanae]
MPDEPVSRTYFSKLLWPDRFEAQAKASLRQCLHYLGKLLNPFQHNILSITRETIHLNRSALQSDLDALEDRLAFGEDDQAITMLDFIGSKQLLEQMQIGDGFDDWLEAQRETVEQRLKQAVKKALGKLEKGGDKKTRRRLLNSWRTRHPEAVDMVATTTDQTKTDKSKSKIKRFRWLVAAATILLALIAYITFDAFRSPAPATNLVRIEPFQVIGDDADLEKLAADITPQLLSALTANRISTILENKPGNALQEFDLKGSISTQGADRQVTLQLLDHGTGRVIWSEIFARPQSQIDLFATHIASKPAGILRCIAQLRSDVYKSTGKSLPLYAQYCAESSDGDYNKNYVLFSEPIYLAEPDNPSAISLYADTLARQAQWGDSLSETERSKLRQKSRMLIDQVIADDPDAPYANYLLANNMPMSGNWAAVEKLSLLATAQTRMPDAVYRHQASLLRQVGRLKDATKVFEELAAANPADVFAHARLGWMYISLGDKIGAKRALAMAERLDPDWPELHIRRLQQDLYLEDAESALRRLREPLVMTTTQLKCSQIFARARLAAKPDLAALEAACKDEGQHWLIRMYVGLGELDRAFDLAERFDWSTIAGSTMILYYSDTAAFRRDPRFWPLAKRIGLLDYWQKTGRWPDFCEDEELPIACKTAASTL